jgi:hypothetical protein
MAVPTPYRACALDESPSAGIPTTATCPIARGPPMSDTINTLDLVRYDPARNCFVLKGSTMHTWEDGTPKSTHNAFNWRNGIRATTDDPARYIPARSLDLHSNGDIRLYTKAVRAEHRVAPPPTSKPMANITYSRKAKK